MKCKQCGIEIYNDWDMFCHYKDNHPNNDWKECWYTSSSSGYTSSSINAFDFGV